MIDFIKLGKGLNIPIIGDAEPLIKRTIKSEVIAVKPTDFRGMIPKLLITEGEQVKAGTPLFADKNRPQIVVCSPVSGTVTEIVRGEKRKILEIRIAADSEIEYLRREIAKLEELTREEIISLLLENGLWVCIKQRPFGITPSPEIVPKAIFISSFHSAPLASDLDFTLRNEIKSLQVGIDVLSKLTDGQIYMGLSSMTYASTPFSKLKKVTFHTFDGPHPSGNVGIQIHHIQPINKGDVVWTIDLHLLAFIGRFFLKGICDMRKVVAVTGPRAKSPKYVQCMSGMCLKEISDFEDLEKDKSRSDCAARYISGDVLTGTNVGKDGFLGFFDDQVTLITEGTYCEPFGWAKPFRFKKFSFAHTYLTHLFKDKRYRMDTNLNGGVRAFVVTGKYDKVLPMDIYPTYLLKAILAGDIDKMEKLGIYEVIEEDFALCEYICPSKIDIQHIISQGIDLMVKEIS